MVRITLTSANMGPEATEADFARWVAFVAGEMDGHVDAHPFGNGPDRDTVCSVDDEDTVRDELAALWQSWCRGGAL